MYQWRLEFKHSAVDDNLGNGHSSIPFRIQAVLDLEVASQTVVDNRSHDLVIAVLAATLLQEEVCLISVTDAATVHRQAVKPKFLVDGLNQFRRPRLIKVDVCVHVVYLRFFDTLSNDIHLSVGYILIISLLYQNVKKRN